MNNPMTRWKAALIHFCISAAIAAAVLIVLIVLWYPLEVFSAAGATRLAQLLIGIDVVLGPLLTLIVFNTAKKSLRFDLSVIVLVQAAALIYGLHVAWTSRPILIVSTGDRFEWVIASRLTPEELAQAPTPELREYPYGKPRTIAARYPSDTAEQQKIFDAVMSGKGDIEVLPKYYVEYADEAAAIARRIKPLDALPRWSDERVKARAAAVLARENIKLEDAGWLPFILKNRDIVMLMRKQEGTPIAPLDTAAWNE